LRYWFTFNFDDELLPLMVCDDPDVDPCVNVQIGNVTVLCCVGAFQNPQSYRRTGTPNNPDVYTPVYDVNNELFPGTMPAFQPCIPSPSCQPGCAVAPTALHLIADNNNPVVTGTFTVCNTSVGSGCPPISGTIVENCDYFSVSPATYYLPNPGDCVTVTVTYAPDHGYGTSQTCDIITGCGTVIVTGDDLVEAMETPAVFSLSEAFPNPFNPSTTIAYSVPETQKATLSVFNTNGQLVQTLVNGMVERGEHKVVFDASNLSSGVYVYSLQAGTQSSLKKMVLVK
jgi:hypothetical protein